MTSTAVIQTKQGIGDVMWHLPFIKAIAATTPERAVTFLTLPSSFARDLLAAEPCVAETVYFENRGSELQRGLHLARLVGLLRARRFDTVWILDRTVRPALAALLAGVPNRIGLGLGPQRLLISNRGIDPALRRELPLVWLEALMAARQVPLATTEPDLQLPPDLVAATAARFAALPRPWIALALGGSHPAKDWPATHWTAFLGELRRRTPGTVLLIGGPPAIRQADDLIAATDGGPAVNACDLSIAEAAALLSLADLFVGPDSGPMNIAAALGTPAFALFGATRVLAYSRFIHAVTPDDGGPHAMDGMARISPAAVIERIAPLVAEMKNAG